MTLKRIEATASQSARDAIAALEQDGAVIIKSAINISYLNKLKQRMDSDTAKLLAFNKQFGYSPKVQGHLHQGPPTHAPFLSEDVLAHPLVWKLAKELLGAHAGVIFYSGNTNCPGSHPQPVHIDQPHENKANQTISTLIASIPVQDMNVENGSIEIWPGSHKLATTTRVPLSKLAEREKIVKPVQPIVCAGDILIRNSRTWHRGMENNSAHYRHMLSLVIHRQPKGKVNFDHSARAFIDGLTVPLNPQYVNYRSEYLFEPTRSVNQTRDANNKNTTADAKPLIDI